MFFVKIDNGFYAIINPQIRNTLKVINEQQYNFLQAIKSGNVDLFYTQNSISDDTKSQLIELFAKQEFIKSDNNFSIEKLKSNPKNLNFWVHTSDDCNLRCSYCYIKTKETKLNMTSSTMELFKDKLIQTIRKYAIESVTLRLSGGEPLLQFAIWETFLDNLKNELENINCRLRIVFLTNLTFLNDKIIQFIKKHKIGIGVSLDGLENYHNNTRVFVNGKGSFNHTIKNIEKLLINGIEPSIMTVVSNSNIEGLPAFTEFLIEKKLVFRYSFVHGEGLHMDKLQTSLNKCYDILENAIDKGYMFTKYHKLADLKFFDISYQTCGSGVSTGSLYHNGDMYFCQSQFGSENVVNSLNSDFDLLEIIKSGNSFNGILSSECNACNYRYICTGGCPLIRINGISPFCEIFKEFIPRYYKIAGKERLNIIKKHINN